MSRIFIDGQWIDREEWDQASQTNWWGLLIAVLAGLALVALAVVLVVAFWEWIAEWVPVIIGVGLLTVMLIAALSSNEP